MRVKDTASVLEGSGAVAELKALGPRSGDVDSTTGHSTRPTTPGARTSMMATRTISTRITTTEFVPSADSTSWSHAAPSLADLIQAHLDCRHHKRNTVSALEFEIHQERNLVTLYDELMSGTYRPGRSIRFVITHPKHREVCASKYRDRIVQHLLYNHICDRFHRRFVADTCACIPGRGTLYGAKRLEHHIRSATENWSKPAWYLKLDIANCFPSLDKDIIFAELKRHIWEPWWLNLAELILYHDPLTDCEFHGDLKLLDRVPPHKRLGGAGVGRGLPIGNLSSQFFLNVLLDVLDQHIKHDLRVRYYARYVDDMVFVAQSPQFLNAVHHAVALFLPRRLGLQLNESKTILQPVDRGVDFVGQVIKPWHRRLRRRTFRYAIKRIASMDAADLHATTNSYFGLCRQTTHSHHDRTQLAKVALRRGRTVDGDFTKISKGGFT